MHASKAKSASQSSERVSAGKGNLWPYLAFVLLLILFAASPRAAAVVNGEKVSDASRVAKMVAKLEITTDQGIFLCTGTFIADDLVLTAAHCLKDSGRPSTVFVRAQNGDAILARSWRIHPNYGINYTLGFLGGPRRPVNDIAIVRLAWKISATNLVAELPNVDTRPGVRFAGVVAGFGRTKAEEAKSAGGLYFAWSTSTVVNVGFNADRQIVMSGAQPCYGDSGGPVFNPFFGHFVVMGVVSYAHDANCSENGRATSVGHHLAWIQATSAALHASVSP